MNQKNTVVLIVDVQNALMEAHPFREEELTDNLKVIIHNARRTGLEVVYVRHDGGEGDELALGTQGWQIFDAAAPQEGERIFEKRYNSAFKDTGRRSLDCVLCNLSTAAFLVERKRVCAGYTDPPGRAPTAGRPGAGHSQRPNCYLVIDRLISLMEVLKII